MQVRACCNYRKTAMEVNHAPVPSGSQSPLSLVSPCRGDTARRHSNSTRTNPWPGTPFVPAHDAFHSRHRTTFPANQRNRSFPFGPLGRRTIATLSSRLLAIPTFFHDPSIVEDVQRRRKYILWIVDIRVPAYKFAKNLGIDKNEGFIDVRRRDRSCSILPISNGS